MEKTPQGNYFSILHSLSNIGMISTFIGGKTERLKPLIKHNLESICVRYRKHDKCIKCVKLTDVNDKIDLTPDKDVEIQFYKTSVKDSV